MPSRGCSDNAPVVGRIYSEGMNDHSHEKDIFIQGDGSEEYRDPWVVTADESLAGAHSGGVCVHEGGTFTMGSRGHLSGSLRLQPGTSALAAGQISGSLHVSRDAVADVSGRVSGSVHVDRGGLVRVLPGGVLAGSLHVSGLIENRGTRGGTVDLSGGEILDLYGGAVKQPTTTEDGVNIYNW